MRPSQRWLTMLALGFAYSGGVSEASVVRHHDVASLARAATDVVHGVVTARASFREGAEGRIVTHTMVRVDRALKGGVAPREIVVRQAGGRVGNVRSFVEGDPEFRVGEEVVLFLERRGATYTLHSLAQAKFTVKSDRAGNRFAVREMRGIVRVATGAALARKVSASSEGSFMLAALFSEIARALSK